jgi:hypothetical protein
MHVTNRFTHIISHSSLHISHLRHVELSSHISQTHHVELLSYITHIISHWEQGIHRSNLTSFIQLHVTANHIHHTPRITVHTHRTHCTPQHTPHSLCQTSHFIHYCRPLHHTHRTQHTSHASHITHHTHHTHRITFYSSSHTSSRTLPSLLSFSVHTSQSIRRYTRHKACVI